MGHKQRGCAGCGAPVGLRDRRHCWQCLRDQRERAAKSACPGCSLQRVLAPDTGRCMRCSRTCSDCGHPVRAKTTTRCARCRRGVDRRAQQRPCPRCGRLGYLRAASGWCGTCSRPRPGPKPPRTCSQCGQLRRHAARGLCSRCFQRQPHLPFLRAAAVAAELDAPPDWLDPFVTHLAARHCPARACTMINTLGRLLSDEHPNRPEAVLDRARRPGRSMGSLARALEDFFTTESLAMPTDQVEQRAAQRRRHRIDASPAALRPGVEAFAESMLQARQRARRAGTRPRSDATIEAALAVIRDLALFLETRSKNNWSLVDVSDVEAFLARRPRGRAKHLTVLGQFFRFARKQRLVLVDPTAGLASRRARGFRGSVLDLATGRALFRRWTTDAAAHPHEALVGLLSLLHAAASHELRALRVDHIDHEQQAIRLGNRPLPVPLDPPSWTALQGCLAHRRELDTANPHVIVTRGTKAGRGPASTAYLSHVLDGCGIRPRVLRSTRLVDLIQHLDPKLVAASTGMTAEGVLTYFTDHVEAVAAVWPAKPEPV